MLPIFCHILRDKNRPPDVNIDSIRDAKERRGPVPAPRVPPGPSLSDARFPKGKHAISGNREPIRPYDFGHWNGFSPRLGAEGR